MASKPENIDLYKRLRDGSARRLSAEEKERARRQMAKEQARAEQSRKAEEKFKAAQVRAKMKTSNRSYKGRHRKG